MSKIALEYTFARFKNMTPVTPKSNRNKLPSFVKDQLLAKVRCLHNFNAIFTIEFNDIFSLLQPLLEGNRFCASKCIRNGISHLTFTPPFQKFQESFGGTKTYFKENFDLELISVLFRVYYTRRRPVIIRLDSKILPPPQF